MTTTKRDAGWLLGAVTFLSLLFTVCLTDCARPLWSFSVAPPGKRETAPTPGPTPTADSVEDISSPLTDFTSPFLVSSEGNVFIRGEVIGLYSRNPIQELRLADEQTQNCRADLEAMEGDGRLAPYTLICLSAAPEIKRIYESGDPPR